MEARLCHTATEVDPYERAAKVANRWGSPVSDDLIHQHVPQRGRAALELELPPPSLAPAEPEFSLVIMLDGWMARERGPDWGASVRRKMAERVKGHEVKSASASGPWAMRCMVKARTTPKRGSRSYCTACAMDRKRAS